MLHIPGWSPNSVPTPEGDFSLSPLVALASCNHGSKSDKYLQILKLLKDSGHLVMPQYPNEMFYISVLNKIPLSLAMLIKEGIITPEVIKTLSCKGKLYTCIILVSGLALVLVQLGKWSLLRYFHCCLLYTSPSPRDRQKSRMPSSA